jgi:hypothetical protein
MSSRLEAGPDGGTMVFAEANAEVTGRVMQFGRGMIQGISDQMFKQFAASVTERLESAQVAQAVPSGEAPATVPLPEQRPINAIAVVLGAILSAVGGLFRRLFRRSQA